MMGNLLEVESSRQWAVKTLQHGPQSCFLDLKNNINVNLSLNEISKILNVCTSQKCP